MGDGFKTFVAIKVVFNVRIISLVVKEGAGRKVGSSNVEVLSRNIGYEFI